MATRNTIPLRKILKTPKPLLRRQPSDLPSLLIHDRFRGSRLTGNFVNSSFGKAVLTLKDDALVIEIQATGAKFKLVPWDGDIFMATLMATDQFGPIVDLDYMTKGFAQFQMDKDGKLNLLRLSAVDGQAYEFRRE